MSSAGRFLVCPPDYYDSHFLFNPWMTYRERVDHRKARAQWRLLIRTMEQAGADVVVMEPVPVSGALVFTADGALVYAEGRALLLRNDGPRGELEPPVFRHWLREHGYAVESLPPGYTLDGGNLLRLHDGSFLVGLKPGARGRSERYLGRLLRLAGGGPVRPLGLVDERYLHLDMVVGRLGDRGYLVYRDGLYRGEADIGVTPVAERQIVYVDLEDARQFACNTVCIGDVVITGPVSPGLKRRIESLGLTVEALPLTEFYKAGGGAKCLTLPLDLHRNQGVRGKDRR